MIKISHENITRFRLTHDWERSSQVLFIRFVKARTVVPVAPSSFSHITCHTKINDIAASKERILIQSLLPSRGRIYSYITRRRRGATAWKWSCWFTSARGMVFQQGLFESSRVTEWAKVHNHWLHHHTYTPLSQMRQATNMQYFEFQLEHGRFHGFGVNSSLPCVFWDYGLELMTR